MKLASRIRHHRDNHLVIRGTLLVKFFGFVYSKIIVNWRTWLQRQLSSHLWIAVGRISLRLVKRNSRNHRAWNVLIIDSLQWPLSDRVTFRWDYRFFLPFFLRKYKLIIFLRLISYHQNWVLFWPFKVYALARKSFARFIVSLLLVII